MSNFIRKLALVICFGVVQSTHACNELNGVWILDTDKTLELLKSQQSRYLEAAQNCYKDQLCFGSLFYFNKESLYVFYPKTKDSGNTNYTIFGPFNYNIISENNNKEIHYKDNGMIHRIGFELQNNYLILKQNNFDEAYSLASIQKIKEVLAQLPNKK